MKLWDEGYVKKVEMMKNMMELIKNELDDVNAFLHNLWEILCGSIQKILCHFYC